MRTQRIVAAHFEAGNHETKKGRSWIHGFLLHHCVFRFSLSASAKWTRRDTECSLDCGWHPPFTPGQPQIAALVPPSVQFPCAPIAIRREQAAQPLPLEMVFFQMGFRLRAARGAGALVLLLARVEA